MLALLKDLGKHSVVYGVGDLISKSIGFLLIPLYTNYLSPEQYGTLDLLDLTSYSLVCSWRWGSPKRFPASTTTKIPIK